MKTVQTTTDAKGARSTACGGSANWSIGDHVLFDAERGYPISRPVRYGGTITARLGNNYWEVIGFGFRAELSGELMTPNPVYSQNIVLDRTPKEE